MEYQGMPKLWHSTLFAFLLSLTQLCSAGERASQQDIKWIYNTLLEVQQRHGLPAMGVAIVTRDGVWAFATSGHRRADDLKTSVDLHDQWHLGSCTKSMTATLVAMLVADDVLRWDLTLSEVFGQRMVHPDLRGVTLRQLLDHEAGLSHTIWPSNLSTNDTVAQRQQLAVEVLSKKPATSVGEHSYSNTGYMIAAAIMEKATGRSWESLIRSRLFAPLGMQSAGFGAPGRNVTPPDSIHGHVNGRPVSPGPGADNHAVAGPAGTVHASISDWGKYIELHLDGAVGDTRLLDKEQFKVLHTPVPGANYACGWIVNKHNKTLSHRGSNNLWYCKVTLHQQDGYSILVTTNVAADVSGCAEAFRDLEKKIQSASDRWLSPLSDYVGVYTLRPGVMLTIKNENKELSVMRTGQRFFAMDRAGHDHFAVRAVDATISFHRNRGGEVDRCVLHQNDLQKEALKVN
jgi:CubicO group peptidase (beta-lactamase class C family)